MPWIYRKLYWWPPFQWFWTHCVPDKCQMPGCCRKGVRGNENIWNGMIVCDYCTAKHLLHH